MAITNYPVSAEIPRLELEVELAREAETLAALRFLSALNLLQRYCDERIAQS